jgi:hypothetical protein
LVQEVGAVNCWVKPEAIDVTVEPPCSVIVARYVRL